MLQTLRYSMTPLTPADIEQATFCPTLLLPAAFHASLVADPEYLAVCEDGFYHYFSEMRQWTPDLTSFVFVNRFYTPQEIAQLVSFEMTVGPHNPTPLASRAGFVLGWLSALALTDSALASQGLHLLEHHVSREVAA